MTSWCSKTSFSPNKHKSAKGFPENYVLPKVINKLTLKRASNKKIDNSFVFNSLLVIDKYGTKFHIDNVSWIFLVSWKSLFKAMISQSGLRWWNNLNKSVLLEFINIHCSRSQICDLPGFLSRGVHLIPYPREEIFRLSYRLTKQPDN